MTEPRTGSKILRASSMARALRAGLPRSKLSSVRLMAKSSSGCAAATCCSRASGPLAPTYSAGSMLSGRTVTLSSMGLRPLSTAELQSMNSAALMAAFWPAASPSKR